MAHRYQGQYVTPDAALKQSEQFLEDGNWESAITILNLALQNRRIKGNNAMMERIMVSLSLTLIHILTRPNLFHFRQV